jgi:Ca2+-binding EF-hand superfamily protein
VEALYRRFRALDRGLKGYLAAEELLAIPELSINPLAQRVVRLFESANFLEFVRLLAPFAARVPRDDKLAFLFSVFDVDGDGVCVWGGGVFAGRWWGGACSLEPRQRAPRGARVVVLQGVHAETRRADITKTRGTSPLYKTNLQKGYVSREDLQVMLRQLAGSTLTDEDLGELTAKGMSEAGPEAAARGLDLAAFKKALAGRDLPAMEVAVPSDLA